MVDSLRLSSRVLLGSILLFACSSRDGMRVLDAGGGPGPDVGLPATAADASDDVLSAPDSRASAGDVPVQVCGNGILDPGEQCDDGNTLAGDGCSSRCQIDDGAPCPLPPCTARWICGDGRLTSNEVCDDGNLVAGDGCSADCQAVEPGFRCRVPSRRCTPICGDRLLKDGETCDDGNTLSGDGCSIYCLTEPGWDCGSGTCVQVPAMDGGVEVIAPYCGDGIISGAEECDEGTSNEDGVYGGCSTKCFFGGFCGNGIVDGQEECDLGPLNGTASGRDGCTIGCTRTHYCGDGIVDSGEECDFGDLNGVKLDVQGEPSTGPSAWVRCTLDCQIPLCCVY